MAARRLARRRCWSLRRGKLGRVQCLWCGGAGSKNAHGQHPPLCIHGIRAAKWRALGRGKRAICWGGGSHMWEPRSWMPRSCSVVKGWLGVKGAVPGGGRGHPGWRAAWGLVAIGSGAVTWQAGSSRCLPRQLSCCARSVQEVLHLHMQRRPAGWWVISSCWTTPGGRNAAAAPRSAQ